MRALGVERKTQPRGTGFIRAAGLHETGQRRRIGLADLGVDTELEARRPAVADAFPVALAALQASLESLGRRVAGTRAEVAGVTLRRRFGAAEDDDQKPARGPSRRDGAPHGIRQNPRLLQPLKSGAGQSASSVQRCEQNDRLPPEKHAPLVQSAFGLSCALPREHNSVHSSLAVGAASVLKPGTASALDLYWSRVSYTSSTVDDDVDVEGGGGERGRETLGEVRGGGA